MFRVFFLMALGVPLWLAVPYDPPGPSDYINTAKFDLAAMERQMFSDVNRVRSAYGLPPYEFSQSLWNLVKNHSRGMALDQRLEPVRVKELMGLRAGNHPPSFWAGMSGHVARVPNIASLAPLVNRWVADKGVRPIFLSPPYNRAAVAVSVDRNGVLYVTLLAGEEVYQEDNLQILERRVLKAVNALRVKRGLPPLQPSGALNRIARGHSRDMALGYYFSHTDPRGRDLAARLRGQGVTHWQASAENIASNMGHRDPAKSAVDGWLASPPHAANMLGKEFAQTGVGVAKAIDDTYYFTQIFIK